MKSSVNLLARVGRRSLTIFIASSFEQYIQTYFPKNTSLQRNEELAKVFVGSELASQAIREILVKKEAVDKID